MGYFGCHLSASDGYLAMVRTAQSIGANTFAFFTRNPRGSQAKKLDESDCRAAMKALEENGIPYNEANVLNRKGEKSSEAAMMTADSPSRKYRPFQNTFPVSG